MNVNPLTEWQYRTNKPNKPNVGAAWSAYLRLAIENGRGAETCPLSALPDTFSGDPVRDARRAL